MFVRECCTSVLRDLVAEGTAKNSMGHKAATRPLGNCFGSIASGALFLFPLGSTSPTVLHQYRAFRAS